VAGSWSSGVSSAGPDALRRTRIDGSALVRLAHTQPPEPAPTTIEPYMPCAPPAPVPCGPLSWRRRVPVRADDTFLYEPALSDAPGKVKPLRPSLAATRRRRSRAGRAGACSAGSGSGAAAHGQSGTEIDSECSFSPCTLRGRCTNGPPPHTHSQRAGAEAAPEVLGRYLRPVTPSGRRFAGGASSVKGHYRSASSASPDANFVMSEASISAARAARCATVSVLSSSRRIISSV
jgi:hypothetical protein